MFAQVGILVIFSAVVIAQQKLPNYIKKCDLKSPDFNQCCVQHANDVIPRLVKGDKKLNIPVLDPLRLPLIEVIQQNFKLFLKNVKIVGLKNIRAIELNMTPEAFDATFHIESLNILGTYNLDGNVMILALHGQGPANITAVGGDYRIRSVFTPYTKNGRTYLKFKKPDIEFTLTRAYFDFGNLFTGDSSLGIDINQLLNENWQDVLKDVGAPIKETVGTIVDSIVSNIISKVPQSEIF